VTISLNFVADRGKTFQKTMRMAANQATPFFLGALTSRRRKEGEPRNLSKDPSCGYRTVVSIQADGGIVEGLL